MTTDTDAHLPNPLSGPEAPRQRISRQSTAEAMMIAARWPEASPRLVLSLTAQLVGGRRYAEAYRMFDELATEQPDRPLFLAVAASFQARLPGQLDEAVGKLDAAVAAEPGLPHYFRGVTLAELPLEAGRTRMPSPIWSSSSPCATDSRWVCDGRCSAHSPARMTSSAEPRMPRRRGGRPDSTPSPASRR
ncbi:hypothetical protein [Saccharopolyspora pogona]|uniref:hypothetical protein n=1 Tax=Saccharopolyspora pogona TaxID=333966 RepID=UPI001686493E|nr:hypothetical protein [Saccharopolyspora pogona]